MVGFPTISVTIAAFAMERWDNIQQAVWSVQAQTVPVLETIVVIDHNPALFDRVQREIPDVTVVPNVSSQGASGARNCGVAASKGEVIAFLDDDAVASPNWLEMLVHHLEDPNVVGVGGKLVPLWASSRPRWFPYEFDWTVGGSYRGMPEKAMPVRNVWSGNMVISRQAFDAIEGFRSGFGKRGGRSCPEDTDLCLRAAAFKPGRIWVYEPAAIVGHHVPVNRTRLRYFLRRCLHEGSGKAALARLNGPSESTSAERRYIRRVLPRGVARGLREAGCGDASGVLRSIAIVAGLSCAVVGFVVGRVSGADHPAVPSEARQALANGQVKREKDMSGANIVESVRI